MLCCQGMLTAAFYQTPVKVDDYFDVSAMRQKNSKRNEQDIEYPVNLVPSELKLLDIRFVGNEIWLVTNTGEKDTVMFFGDTSTITVIPDDKFF